MRGLALAKNNLRLRECQTFSEEFKCPLRELEENLRGKISSGIFAAWQIQSVVWGKFDGEKLLLRGDCPPNIDDWLECRIFNESEEIHLKRDGEIMRGRYIRDTAGTGTDYVDSFARLWGERVDYADGWITLRDDGRKISMEIPCDFDAKKCGLTTRNYIGSDDDTGLSGYVDYRFVAIDSAWDGD